MRYTGKWTTAVSLFLHIGIWSVIVQCYGSGWRTSPVFAGATAMLIASMLLSLWMGRRLDAARQASYKDALTGLYNRRYVARRLPQLLKKAKESGTAMSVSMIDVNDFKHLNDTYGHHTGDVLLQQIAYSIASSLRKGEFAARWGGDEFIVVSPNAGRDRLALQDAIDAKLQQLAAKRQLDSELTVSVGTAVYPHDAESFEELLHTADGLMFESKSKRKQSAVCERQPKIG